MRFGEILGFCPNLLLLGPIFEQACPPSPTYLRENLCPKPIYYITDNAARAALHIRMRTGRSHSYTLISDTAEYQDLLTFSESDGIGLS
jgi:hypothetical protein